MPEAVAGFFSQAPAPDNLTMIYMYTIIRK